MSAENKLKHLEFIQSVISRMSSNSFLLKGWSVTLVAALFALAAKDANKNYVVVAYLPLLVFWTLDAYFLSQERLFRRLYEDVRERPEHDVDFSMSTKRFRGGRNGWAACLASRTLALFYLPMVGLTLVVTHFIH